MRLYSFGGAAMRNLFLRPEWTFTQPLGIVASILILAGWALPAQPGRAPAPRSPLQTLLTKRTASQLAGHAASEAKASLKGDPGGGIQVPESTDRRDPFKLPPPPAPPGSSRMAEAGRLARLPPGRRGLIISDLNLEGVVSENSGRGMIAIVTNQTGRAYFLETNEKLYDGEVTRITPQSVYFEERVRGRQGKMNVLEVVKSLNSKAGDGQ